MSNRPPLRIPTVIMSGRESPKFSACVIPGKSKDQNDAANMIPADAANIPSSQFLFTFLNKKTILEPKAVISHVKRVAKNAWIMGLSV